MNSPVRIRHEQSRDMDVIHEVTVAAFLNALHSDHNEQVIVQGLREAGALSVSLVAEQDGRVVGHVAVSPVSVSDGAADWYGLGPISVLPEYQGQGVGSRLMRRALSELQALGAAGCVLLGDPDYYHRFGFKAMERLRFPGVPPEYFQALPFIADLPDGTVQYHPAFFPPDN